MGVVVPDLRKGQMKNRDKTRKCSFPQGFDGEILLFVLMVRTPPFHLSDSKYPL